MGSLARASRRELAYLEVIKGENDRGRGARLSVIAKALGISPASAHEEIMHLLRKGYVRRMGGLIYITERGLREIDLATRVHRIMETLLVRAGLDPSSACELSKSFDFMVPEEVVERLYEYLGKPATCPHGNEIP